MRLSGLLALGWLGLAPMAAAQTVVNHPFNTGVVATYTFDSGPNTAYFDYFDSGGGGGNYSNSSVAANSVVTFVAPAGRRIRVTFSAFQTESTWADRLYVYDGADTSASIRLPLYTASPATPRARTTPTRGRPRPAGTRPAAPSRCA